jgi:DNA polymerase elongation subunit (family B)
MISKSILENCLFFDIETVGSYENFWDLEKKEPHLAELWKKRAKWLEKKDEFEKNDVSSLWENKSSLHPEFGKIVCVSFGILKDGEIKLTSFYGDDERYILENVNKILANSRIKSYRLSGQNIKNFDIPYLGKRMLINGINPDPMIHFWNKKPWEVNLLDLAEVFSFGAWGQTFSSLDLISYSLGIKGSKENMDGSLVHSNFWKNKETEEIKKYCEEDVTCTIRCFEKISS